MLVNETRCCFNQRAVSLSLIFRLGVDRFILELSDPSLIGKRRAAQRLMADALKQLGDSDASEEEISKALDVSLEEMVKEIK